MKNILFIIAILIFTFPINAQEASENNQPVCFITTDSRLQDLYNHAIEKSKQNLARFGKYKVLVEGAGYNNVWLETQPMGGYMYGKRDPEIARNNIVIFIDYQRSDGRFPGMISCENGSLKAHYGWFQGFYLAEPAFESWFLFGKDKKFIRKVYDSLQAFDDYLWRTRDSNKNGCLEIWCLGDAGEDNSVRLGKIPQCWPFDNPPLWNKIESMPANKRKEIIQNLFQDSIKTYLLPVESMDIMSYSYTCRDVLAKIAHESGNDREIFWRTKADEVKKALKGHLWDSDRHACYDKDNAGKVINILIHNNLRCMYFGSFNQHMADEFIRFHLMNKKEFWTPFPLPSIAVSDKMFKNEPGNDWSGQPQGLTYQRSIRALENYNHYAELTLLGKAFLGNLKKYNKFTQQYDPFTGTPNQSPDGYGPTILATLEFISRMYGIHITQNKIYWSCILTNEELQYTQRYRKTVLQMKTNKNKVNCYINGKKILSFNKGLRIITDLNGKLTGAAGIETTNVHTTIYYNHQTYKVNVMPNSTYTFNGKMNLLNNIPFYKPF